jgi:hypothetical protein
LEVEQANEAALYTDDATQVAMAISHLVGTARDCAFTCIDQAKSENREAFPSWQDFKKKLNASFNGEHARHNERAKFLACKQKRRSVFDYIQLLRQLSASVIGDPLSETTKITVLREGLNVGSARTQLFRTDPKTFEDACNIALAEDASQRRANNLRMGHDTGPIPSSGSGPSPMDVGSTELSRVRQASNVRCYQCNSRGHYARACPKPRRRGQPGREFPGGRGTPPGRGFPRRRSHSIDRPNGMKKVSFQGNGRAH